MRSIPARAGEPHGLRDRETTPEQVYPRACGGTATRVDITLQASGVGLSPRVRGNRREGL